MLVVLRAHREPGIFVVGHREKTAHTDLRVGFVLVMNLDHLARATCVSQQGVGWAALGLCDLRRETWHEFRVLGMFC